jgi:folate-binding protein YgfZ
MNKNLITLNNRCVISISGADRKTFLQGLITNDINKVSETQAIYTLMLSPVGRFLYDFFIIEKGDKLLVDCCKERVDEIVQKLSFYKLRSKVEIAKENFAVIVSKSEIGFVDPRNSKMGYRDFAPNHLNLKPLSQRTLGSQDAGRDPSVRWDDGVNDDNESEYNFHRINLKIPDDSDLTYDKSFPLEFGFDNFNAIDYKKGCYVGQETTARTHYKGIIRKKIFLAEIVSQTQIEKGTEIETEDKKIGEILSSVFAENKLLALALIKNLDNEGKEINLEKLKLIVAKEGKKQEIKIIK